MATWLTIALVAIAPLLAQAAPTSIPIPTVSIASGVVVGTATRVSNQPSVTALAKVFLGVPFARPPMRFAPPTPPQPWSTLTAQTLPPACLQQFIGGDLGARTQSIFGKADSSRPTESEDCLYLNIFAPQHAGLYNLKPVMFWIYGGNLMFGSASLDIYNGSSLAVNEDVIVVAANYRTNSQQNSGFLDQRLALQWVQDNIAAFGGDRSKATIFGESAGGYSVKQLLAQPPSPRPFRAAIMESEATLFLGNSLFNYEQVVLNFGCGFAPSPLECLRDVSGSDILEYISNNTLLFAPVADDTNVNNNADVSVRSGQFADVPILIGTNSNEFSVLAVLLGLNLTNEAIRVATDYFFTCPTKMLADVIAQEGRQPVWRYFYEGTFPNTTPFPGAGTYHSAEIPEVFGTYPLVDSLGHATNTQIALSATMQRLWASFARHPTHALRWPRVGSTMNGYELGVLGGLARPSGESTQSLSVADGNCPIYEPLLLAAGRAY